MKIPRWWVIPILLLVSPLAARPPSTELRILLSKQGFHAPLNKNSDVKYVGEIVQGIRRYQIYYYRYVIPENKRGVGRLIILINNKIYLGSYDVTTTDSCHTKGKSVFCDTWSGYDKEIRFTKHGPPAVTYIDGRIAQITPGSVVSN